MIQRDDHHLKRVFAALRRQDAADGPSFQSTVAAARARRASVPRRRVLALAALVVVAVIAMVVASTWRVQRSAGLGIDLATVRWQAPTDFLLKLPGVELLRSVPQLGPRGLDRRIL